MPVVHLEQIMQAAIFAGVRIGGMFLFPPFFSSDAIPVPVKAALTIALTALMYPVYGPIALHVDVLGWLRVAAGELTIGLLLGLSLQFVFEAALAAGQMIGVQTGYSLITVLDPQTQADTQVLAIFHQLTALLIFLRLDVHHWLLRGLAASFIYLPPGTATASFEASVGLLREAGGIWLAALQIAIPVILATLLVDVALGFLGKASPQLPVMLVGLSVKNLIGLTALAGTLALWPRMFDGEFARALAAGERLLHLAAA
jgi:flagellar biosynthetic protein FliR